MGYIDVPLILLTLAIVIAGQAFWSVHSRKRRASAAILQKQDYFNKLKLASQKIAMEVTERIQDLKLENQQLAEQLKELGLPFNQRGETDSHEDLIKMKSILEQKKNLQESLDNELVELCRETDLLEDTTVMDLSDKIDRLRNENQGLEIQSQGVDRLIPSSEDPNMDPEIKDYLIQSGSKYSLDQLDALYEKLLEEKAFDPNNSLESYEARIKSYDYDDRYNRIEVERKRIEMRHERAQKYYLDDVESFNQSRIEYCFKLPAVMAELAARKEFNDTEQSLVKTYERLVDSKHELAGKSRPLEGIDEAL